MGVLGDRLIVDGNRQYRLRSDGRAVPDLIARLESGELPARGGRLRARSTPGRRGRRAGPRRPGGRRRAWACRWSRRSPRRPPAGAGAVGAGLGRRCSRGAAQPVAAGDGRRAAPGLRLLGRQPRGRPEGRRPGRAGVLGLLARHRASPRARPGQRRLLVPPGRPPSRLRPAGRGGPAAARRARRRRPAPPDCSPAELERRRP